jgi:hypothetical protein
LSQPGRIRPGATLVDPAAFLLEVSMVEYEEIKKTYIEKRIKKRICDKCGNKITVSLYDVYNPEIYIRFGNCFPEGGSGWGYKIELCEDCVTDMVQLLIMNGYSFREEDWDC